MKKIFYTLLLFTGLFGFFSTTFAKAVEVAGEGSPKLYVVKIHAKWCGSCKALKPKLAEVKKALHQKPVLFIKLDVSDEMHAEQSRLLAAGLGIEKQFKDKSGAAGTGAVLIIDPESREIVGELSNDNSVAEMIEAIEGKLN